MANILDGMGLEGSILDGLDDYPDSNEAEWSRITRELVASTIADMDLPSRAGQVEEAFIGTGLRVNPGSANKRSSNATMGDEADRQRRRLL